MSAKKFIRAVLTYGPRVILFPAYAYRDWFYEPSFKYGGDPYADPQTSILSTLARLTAVVCAVGYLWNLSGLFLYGVIGWNRAMVEHYGSYVLLFCGLATAGALISRRLYVRWHEPSPA